MKKKKEFTTVSSRILSLQGRLEHASWRGEGINPVRVEELRQICPPERFVPWLGRLVERNKPRDTEAYRVGRLSHRAQVKLKKRAAKLAFRAARRASKSPVLRLTRTVEYTYDPADNARLDAFYASPEWKMTRYEALRRDGAKCACCGATEGKMVVDHIQPLRVFWHLRLEMGNLQVLCDDCNRGKGARHADDWRK